MAKGRDEYGVGLQVVDRLRRSDHEAGPLHLLSCRIVINRTNHVEPHLQGDATGRVHDVTGAIEHDARQASILHVAQHRTNSVLVPPQTVQGRRILLETELPLVPRPNPRQPVGKRSNAAVEHLDVARIRQLGENPVHGAHRHAEFTRQNALGHIRSPLQLDQQQAPELSARKIIESFQRPTDSPTELVFAPRTWKVKKMGYCRAHLAPVSHRAYLTQPASATTGCTQLANSASCRPQLAARRISRGSSMLRALRRADSRTITRVRPRSSVKTPRMPRNGPSATTTSWPISTNSVGSGTGLPALTQSTNNRIDSSSSARTGTGVPAAPTTVTTPGVRSTWWNTPAPKYANTYPGNRGSATRFRRSVHSLT